MRKPKIVIFDLEIIPIWKEVLKIWPRLGDYPGLTRKATICSICSAGFKVYGEKKTHCINTWDFPEWEGDINDDKKLCIALRKELEDADAVVTWNGRAFDWKFFQTRLMSHGLKPLPNIHHMDMCIVARANLYAFNNKLNTIGNLLSSDQKLKTGGWDLWVDVCHRVKKSCKLMARKCKQDVNLLEKCFIELRPFLGNLENLKASRSKKQVKKKNIDCPKCDHDKTLSKGWRVAQMHRYQRRKCMKCNVTSKINNSNQNQRVY